jgi:hypothetical protein
MTEITLKLTFEELKALDKYVELILMRPDHSLIKSGMLIQNQKLFMM